MTIIQWHKISTLPKTDGWKICVVDNDGEPYVTPIYRYGFVWYTNATVSQTSTWSITKWADMPKVKKL